MSNTNTAYKALGFNLAAYRRRAGMSVQDVANYAKVSIQTIYNLESGSVTRPQSATVRDLRRAFGVVVKEKTNLKTKTGNNNTKKSKSTKTSAAKTSRK